MTMKAKTTKVITGKNTRFSYLNANEPKSINGSTPKYSVSSSFQRMILRPSIKSKQQLNLPTRKANLSSKVMENLSQHFLSLKHRFVTETQNALMTRLIAMLTSSMPTRHISLGSLTVIAKRLSILLSFTQASMVVRLSPSMPLTLTVTRELLVDLTTCKNSVTENHLVDVLVQKTTLRPMMTMIS